MARTFGFDPAARRGGLESQITTRGPVQRGEMPTTTKRLLAISLGTAGAHYIAEGTPGELVAARGHTTEALPLEKVAGKKKSVPLGHPRVDTTRQLGISLEE